MTENQNLEPDPLFNEDREDLDLENEILLMKLQAEFGGCHFVGEDIPPALHNHFLKSVYDYEKMMADEPDNPTTVYDRLSHPFYLPDHFLTDEGITSELARIRKVMQNENIILDCLYEYPDRTIYSFITSQLFKEEIEHFFAPGYYRHFIYEEFYPNDREDIKKDFTRFIRDIMNDTLTAGWNILHENFYLSDGTMLNESEVLDKISQFRRNFVSMELNEFSLLDFIQSDEERSIRFSIDYKVELPDSEWMYIAGDGFAEFVRDGIGYWAVRKFSIPGLQM